MAFDIKTLAAVNLGIQLLLTLVLLGAVHLAKSMKFEKHCKVMRIAFPVQILAILAVMLPSRAATLSMALRPSPSSRQRCWCTIPSAFWQ
jgi:hypothetical protein